MAAIDRLMRFVVGAACCGFVCNSFAQKSATNNATVSSTDTNAIRAEMDAAIHQVEKIVNQPVVAYRKAPGMHVSTYPEGWFHPGAGKPDFERVDVRKYQETPYAKSQYVTSSLNPGLVFLGSDLEFNSMTKYFYTNRNIPKKKLTGPEMEEINRLYRIIGRCEHRLVPPPSALAGETGANATEAAATPAGHSATRSIFLNPWIAGGLAAGVLLIILFNRLARS